MGSRLIRLLFVLFAIAAGVAASYYLKKLDAAFAKERADTGALQLQAQALLTTLADVRAAQVGYVARGQGEDFWMGRVSSLLPVLDRQIGEFNAALSSPAAQADLDSATTAIENFHKLDARAQEYVKGGDPSQASDLIFSDGLGAMATAASQVQAALNSELRAREASTAELKSRQLMILAGGAGGVLLILLVLGFSGASRMPEIETGSDPVPSPIPAPAPVASAEPATSRSGNTADSGSLANAARVCTDMARVLETTQLSALLERIAKVLDASGIIVWIADPSGRDLRPAMAFGYSEQLMARMGTISRDASNAAAAAFRAGEMRTAPGDASTNGALVAPLLTADGCIGVMSAEMKGGSEKNEGSQALASIFAAQLATLVSPSSSAALTRAAEA